jgi:small subunit ribosomal protein S1
MGNGRLEAINSWNAPEQLHELTMWHRTDTMVQGVVRSVIEEKVRAVQSDDSTQSVKQQVLVITLQNGTTGYCAAENFSTDTFRNYRQFVGRKAYFFVDTILLDENYLVLNGKRAQEERAAQFMGHVKEQMEAGTLTEHNYTAYVTGVTPNGNGVYVNIEGRSFFMSRLEWSWNSREPIRLTGGEEIEVRITKVDLEKDRVYVSRKRTLPDPYAFLQSLKVGDPVAGKVSAVHPIDGIFVELENGLDVKASKVGELEEPVVGDVVSCVVIREIRQKDRGRIVGRVLITRYPRGKAVRKDLGSFLLD